MVEIIHIISALLPLAYALLVYLYLHDFYKQSQKYTRFTSPAMMATLIFHGIYLLSRSIEFEHPPISSRFEIFSLIAFGLLMLYVLIEMRTAARDTGGFILFFALLFQISSSLFVEDTYVVKSFLKNAVIGFHIISALLGYIAITLSATYSLLYLVLYKKIKTKNYGVFYQRLPSLELLLKLSSMGYKLGFVFLTVAIIVGGIWLPIAIPNFSAYDPKLIFTMVIWVLYGIGLLGRAVVHWQNKTLMYFSLAGFVLTITSLIVMSFFTSSFHLFSGK